MKPATSAEEIVRNTTEFEREEADRRKKKESKKETWDADFRGFINMNLTDAQKANIDGWLEESDLQEFMDRLCTDGVVLSVKVDTKSGGFLASATQRRTGSVNAGLATTARGRDVQTAWNRLLFTLAILGDGSWEGKAPIADPDRW